MTLCIIHQHPKILLAMKKRGFGAGRWNGYGGKLQKGEDVETAMKRESQEEIGIIPKNYKKVAILNFRFPKNKEDLDCDVHVFKALDFEGKPQETEEMKPEWFEVDKIPFDSMWSDDSLWMPLFLQNKIFKGKFMFDENDNIIEHFLEEVEKL